MDATPHDASSVPTRQTTPDLVTTLWRMVGPSHHPLVCTLHRTPAGLELRARYDHGELVRSATVESEGAAKQAATQWKAAMMAVGSFRDLDAPEGECEGSDSAIR
jgi:hypothetical protein